jgi:outer membrane murein-binding lipoprotein Lpp
VDFTPYVAPIVTAIITGGATYAAMVSRLTRLEVRVEHLEHDQIDANTLSAQIAALSAKMDDLRADVEKHNNLVERMCKVEQQIPTMWKRQDELRDAMHDIKIGGTN